MSINTQIHLIYFYYYLHFNFRNYIWPLKHEGLTRTSTEATPFSLVYGMEAVLPIEVKILSLQILMEAKLEEAEWIQARYDQLNLIKEKDSRLNVTVNYTKNEWYELMTRKFVHDNSNKEI